MIPDARARRARRLRRTRSARRPSSARWPRSAAPSAWRSPGGSSRIFNRVIGLDSIEPLDEIAAFYGEHAVVGVGLARARPRARGARVRRDYGWMKFTRGVAPARGAQRPLASYQVGPDRAGRLRARSSSAVSDCPTGPSRSRRTSSAAPAGRATSPTTATRPAGAGALYVRRRRRLARIRRDAAGRTAAAAPRARFSPPASRTRAGRAARRSPPRPASSPTTARRARTATSSGPASARPVSGRTTAPPRVDPPPSQVRWRDACAGGLACAARRRGGRCLGGADGGGPNTAPDRRVVPELLDPALQQSTVTLMKQREPRRHRPGDGHLGAEPDERSTRGCSSDLRNGIDSRAGRRDRRLPRRLSDRQLADAEDDRRADALRDLARRRRPGAARA